MRILRSQRGAMFIIAGLLAGVVAWLVGPRAAVALAMALGVIGGLVALQWLRNWLGTELRRIRTDDSVKKQLAASEKRVLAELGEAERRIRISSSGDLAALEKRLRLTSTDPV